MSARVNIGTLERATSLDIRIENRLVRREIDRALTLLRSTRHLFGPVGSSVSANREALPFGACLGGLEVEYVSGSTVKVKQGALFSLSLVPASETRPGTWSGQIEPDDWQAPITVLPADSSVAPASPISSPLASPEWWVVYATAGEATIESNSAGLTFNTSTGNYDASSLAKVKQNKLTVAVARGLPGGGFPSFTGYPLAHIYVPAGATDLSAARIDDVRQLPSQDAGPNAVGGSWECPLSGELPAPYTAVIWRGEVWARIRGERLRVVSDGGLKRADLEEPGATWGSEGDGTTRIAWLYLCKVRGLVPRPARKGSAPFAYGLTTTGALGAGSSDGYVAEGALVLSPAPPRCGIFQTGGGSAGSTSTGLRPDLRPSRSLTLPSSTSGGTTYAYAGETVSTDDALLVGMMIYDNTVSGHPILVGPLSCDEQGWHVGDVFNATVGGLFCTLGHTIASTDLKVSAAVEPITLSIPEGTAGYPPIEAIRVMIAGQLSIGGEVIDWKQQDFGRRTYPTGSSPYAFAHLTERRLARGYWGAQVAEAQASGTATFSSVSKQVMGLKMPFGSALVT